jgi:hypothetical protein
MVYHSLQFWYDAKHVPENLDSIFAGILQKYTYIYAKLWAAYRTPRDKWNNCTDKQYNETKLFVCPAPWGPPPRFVLEVESLYGFSKLWQSSTFVEFESDYRQVLTLVSNNLQTIGINWTLSR